jgi:molybdopterin-guanine dinucleotide biosynthesis protein A
MPSAAILTGGRAIRYGGRDKGALVVQGRTIRQRLVDELSQVSDDLMIVGSTNRSAGGSEAVDRRVRQVVDRVQGCGPLAGVDAALAAALHDPVIVVAGDMPFVTAAFLRYLLSLIDGVPVVDVVDAVDAVVPRTEDGYHPLCAVYSRSCRTAVARRLADGQLAMTGILEDLRTRVVTGDEIDRFGGRAKLLANVNTPAAFDELDALQGHEA